MRRIGTTDSLSRLAAESAAASPRVRGCVFFNYGDAYALRLLVAVFSLRRVYDGPITTFLDRDNAGTALRDTLAQLGSDAIFLDHISKSWERHRLFLESPYETTLSFDSDVVFCAPIDGLWAPVEREGVLVTRFYPAPYGVDGSTTRPGWANRVGLLEGVRDLVDDKTYADALRRMVDERIDINVGVMGIARPRGDDFLTDWSERMERGRSSRIPLMDEMLVVALSAKHRHFLAEERWNCPADEFFRRTNLADANIIHYFADGLRIHGIRLGRNPATWAGRKWYEAYHEAARHLVLKRWERTDPTFSGRFRRLFAHGIRHAVRLVLREARRRRNVLRNRTVRFLVQDVAFSAQQAVLALLTSLGYLVAVGQPAKATVIILSYKRMDNIPLIVRSALLCGFVGRVVVSNNNPDVDLRPHVTTRDSRLVLRQQQRHLGPSYRYDLAREYSADYYICIDDDEFPTPWQLRRIFKSLIADPSAPRGTAGEVYDAINNRLMEKTLRPWSRRDQTQAVDVIGQVHAFTRHHLAAYFELVERMNTENSSIHSSEDVIISFTGSGRPILEDVGYIFTFDDDCVPPPHRATRAANPLLDHLANLQSPSHPDYFNTLYDIEFVRGYPHSLRKGKPTAISHGLWLEHPDLDAITHRSNPDLRIRDEVPVVQSVPRGLQYSMCGMNLAFDRHLIGPAMYFGLMGDGQPWGRYDDLWAGWCSKVVCDHLGFGVKTGRPYVVHRKASNWRQNLERESNGIRWGSSLHRFFETVTFERRHANVAECYLALADQVERRLGALHPYFVRLAEAMRVWVGLCHEFARGTPPPEAGKRVSVESLSGQFKRCKLRVAALGKKSSERRND